ncbi:Crp/Fnr family transcriptional regulator [Parahaliea mediterranea]|uniref:Crp/Fnr family transcriptional regulator n=1 Tax=Parahaliea mediterranea TaxID=651086 RepID=A0A939IML5_9GAMM|nr:Crp/Fnr family transcriptional regulator [Parahaliea mediterranea]MBN7797163.1 Crp/Fnr family transcriptional regulator [Parahaliea mediterranea]
MRKVQGLHSWIDSLPPALRETVRARMNRRPYEDGQPIYLIGEEGRELFQIVSGKVRVVSFTEEGKEVQLAELRSGDCFGELSLITGLGRDVSMFATGQTELLVLRRGDFQQLYDDHREIPRELNKLLAHRLIVSYTILTDACLLPLRHRLTRVLAQLAYSEGTTDENGNTIVEGVTHEKLATMLGVTRQAITREMKVLEETELVHARYSRVCVPEISRLVASCKLFSGGELIVPDYSD